MPASGISLLDANVWLALAVEDHVHHTTAQAWYDAQEDATCAFCRVTQMALLRHLTNKKIMSASLQTRSGAWVTYDALSSDPRVLFVQEPAALESQFRASTQGNYPGHDQWTDCYLAAFATAIGAELVTFDAQLKGQSVRLLTP